MSSQTEKISVINEIKSKIANLEEDYKSNNEHLEETIRKTPDSVYESGLATGDMDSEMLAEEQSETHTYGADIPKLMDLIINSFYSNTDIFLRELLSNASDALDKIKFKSLDVRTGGDSLNLEIKIKLDPANNKIIIEDSGIGLSKEDLRNNLGTIANSGTKNFMETLKKNKEDLSLIGQFGVGFYSAFLVADTVEIFTKKNDNPEIYWSSDGATNYTIKETTNKTIKRGTKIILNLKKDCLRYVEENNIRDIIKTHSEYISYPIKLWVEKEREIQELAQEKDENNTTVDAVDDGVTVEDADVEDLDTGTKTETYSEWEQLNIQKPIWVRDPKNISEEMYHSFYETLSGDTVKPITFKHFKIEGSIDAKGIIYIPDENQLNMFSTQENEPLKSKIKIYAKKIFITDDCKNVLPEYLSFISGIIDTEDLSLNVSREILQQSKVMKTISKSLTKKALDLIHSLTEDDAKYEKFYRLYSKQLKLGVYQDTKYRKKLTELLRFNSSSRGYRSFKDYSDDMGENQPGIYYITGENINIVSNSPFVEKLKKKGWEVLYFVDPIDEYMLSNLTEYNGHKLICITKSGIDFGDSDIVKEEFKKTGEKYESLCKDIKEVLSDKVNAVVISNRIIDSPCCLVSESYGMTANMERILKAQTMGKTNSMSDFMRTNKILEINPENSIIRELYQKRQDNIDITETTELMYNISLLNSGFSIDNPALISQQLYKLLSLNNDEPQEEVIELSNDTAATDEPREEEEVIELSNDTATTDEPREEEVNSVE